MKLSFSVILTPRRIVVELPRRASLSLALFLYLFSSLFAPFWSLSFPLPLPFPLSSSLSLLSLLCRSPSTSLSFSPSLYFVTRVELTMSNSSSGDIEVCAEEKGSSHVAKQYIDELFSSVTGVVAPSRTRGEVRGHYLDGGCDDRTRRPGLERRGGGGLRVRSAGTVCCGRAGHCLWHLGAS